MNLFRKIFFFISFFSVIFFSAQTDFVTKKKPFLKPYSVSIASGLTFISGQISDSAEFQSLVKKDNPALHPDLALYARANRASLSRGREFAFAFSCKIRNRDGTGYRERSVLRFGINFSRQSFLSSSYRYTKSDRFDTLSSSSNTIYLDSFYMYRYDFSYDIKQVGLDASWLFNTDPAKNFGLYGGITIGEYFSRSSAVDVTFTERIQVKETNLSGQSTNYNNGGKPPKPVPTVTAVDAKNSFTTRVGIPVGVTMRLAKTIPVLKNIQLFFESRPGLGITTVKGYKTYVRPWMTGQLGFRVLFF